MAETTGIPWTDHTFNLAWGCTKISPGCANCYAKTLSERWGFEIWGENPRRIMSDKYWNQPINWNEKARKLGVKHKVFTSSMADVFEDHPDIDTQRERLWDLIKKTPNLIWQVLTKRSDRIKANLPADWNNGYPNVWIGASIENNDYVYRAKELVENPAIVHFISYEPALSAIPDLDLTDIEWVIYGGESGNEFRQDNENWAREIRDKCLDKKIAFFYKQGANLKPGRNTMLDGQEWKQFP